MYKFLLSLFLMNFAVGKCNHDINDSFELQSPMPGKIIRTFIENGQFVHKNEPLLEIEALKMQNTVQAIKSGYVHFSFDLLNNVIDQSQVLLTLTQLPPRNSSKTNEDSKEAMAQIKNDSDQVFVLTRQKDFLVPKNKGMIDKQCQDSENQHALPIFSKSTEIFLPVQILSNFMIIPTINCDSYFNIIFSKTISAVKKSLDFLTPENKIKKAKTYQQQLDEEHDFNFGYKKLVRLISIFKDYLMDHFNTFIMYNITFIMMLYLIIKPS